jgi:hypothetical protein
MFGCTEECARSVSGSLFKFCREEKTMNAHVSKLSSGNYLFILISISVFFTLLGARGASACGGWTDIGCNAVHTVTKAGQDTVKTVTKAGQDTAKTVTKAGQDTVNTVTKAGQDTVNTVTKAAQDTGNTVQTATQDTGKTIEKGLTILDMPWKRQVRTSAIS